LDGVADALGLTGPVTAAATLNGPNLFVRTLPKKPVPLSMTRGSSASQCKRLLYFDFGLMILELRDYEIVRSASGQATASNEEN
jgi:hypothetical protein